MKIELEVTSTKAAMLVAEFLPKLAAQVEADLYSTMYGSGEEPVDGRLSAAGPNSTGSGEVEEPSPRLFGQAPEGKKRRTKEEMAEDEMLEGRAGALAFPIPDEITVGDLTAALDALSEKGEDKPNISETPEDRKNPAEAAEGETAPEEADETPPTISDLKKVLADYVNAVGADTAKKEAPKFLGAKRVSEVPEDEYGAAIARLKAATPGNSDDGDMFG